jgi:hypothetical protein
MCARTSAEGRGKIKRIICNAPYPEPSGTYWYGETEKRIYVDTWDEALSLLREHHGPGAKVAVTGDATISFFG